MENVCLGVIILLYHINMVQIYYIQIIRTRLCDWLLLNEFPCFIHFMDLVTV